MMESPEWKKPSEVMKIHRRRKSLSQKRITADADKRTSVIYKSPSKSQKRKNPFHKDSPHPYPAKRQHISFEENELKEQAPLSCQLFSILESAEKAQNITSSILGKDAEEILKERQYNSLQKQETDRHRPSKETKDLKVASASHKDKPESKVSAFLPVDWSLKTKLRVVSSRPLDWCTHLKSADEAHGVTGFVCGSDSMCDKETERKRQFHRCCMYWIHPNIPWMNLFPRIVDDSKSSLSVSYLLQEEVQRSLQADWEQSFTSAYHQLRSGMCPYFYVCTHQFTVFFYNKCGSQSGVVAMVTPTTRGFRESLENEGIEFKLPVGSKSSSPGRKENLEENVSDVKTETGEETGETKDKAESVEADGDDILETDDAAHTWLESMGLDKKQFPSLDPKKVKLQREGFRVIDHRPESLVLIEGSDVQAFFNFLLNCRTCVAMSGLQAGLPPTILCPHPFKGATLKCLKVKHTAVKQSDREGNVTQAHIVEVAGPIFPYHCQSLVTLLHGTQKADFGMVFNNHDPTVPFNVLNKFVQSDSSQVNSNHRSIGRSIDNGCVTGNDLDVSSNIDEETASHPELGLVRDGKRPGNNNPSFNDLRNNQSTILETIDEEREEDKNVLVKSSTTVPKPELVRFHKLVPIEEDRVCALKEVVCTPDGFTWTT